MHERSYYEMNCGQYVLHDTSGRPIHKCLDEVAIAFALDAESKRFILHKHGDPEWVNAWAQKAKEKLSAAGALGQQMADEIQVIQGAFPLAILNGALEGRERDMQALFGMATAIDVKSIDVTATAANSSDAEFTPVRRLSPR